LVVVEVAAQELPITILLAQVERAGTGLMLQLAVVLLLLEATVETPVLTVEQEVEVEGEVLLAVLEPVLAVMVVLAAQDF